MPRSPQPRHGVRVAHRPAGGILRRSCHQPAKVWLQSTLYPGVKIQTRGGMVSDEVCVCVCVCVYVCVNHHHAAPN